MAKRPAFQFYPGDWIRSTDLRTCSICARGLWIDMICLMHEGVPYGHLSIGMKPIAPATLAKLVGEDAKNVSRWLGELEQSGVLSVTEEGCYFSRRMVRDEELRNSRAAGGVLDPDAGGHRSHGLEGRGRHRGPVVQLRASTGQRRHRRLHACVLARQTPCSLLRQTSTR